MSGCGGAGATTGVVAGPEAATPTPLAVAFTPPSAAATVAARVTALPKDTPRPQPTAVPTLVPGTPVKFAQVQLIFTNFCVGCHPSVQGMDLTEGKSYDMVVSVPSNEAPTLMRIKPGDPDQSYLYQKISQVKPSSGVQMPRNGDPLSPAEQSVIREWIRQGAKRQ